MGTTTILRRGLSIRGTQLKACWCVGASPLQLEATTPSPPRYTADGGYMLVFLGVAWRVHQLFLDAVRRNGKSCGRSIRGTQSTTNGFCVISQEILKRVPPEWQGKNLNEPRLPMYGYVPCLFDEHNPIGFQSPIESPRAKLAGDAWTDTFVPSSPQGSHGIHG